jgi:hypothetical protein
MYSLELFAATELKLAFVGRLIQFRLPTDKTVSLNEKFHRSR